MIDKLSLELSRMIIRENIIQESELDKLEYGFKKIFNYIIQIAILTVISLLLGFVPHMVCYVLFFTKLRTRVGGWHAASRVGCIGTFTVLSTCIVTCAKYVAVPAFVPICLAMLTVPTVFILAPIMHPNAPKSARSLQKFKRQGRILVLIEAILIVTASVLVPTQWMPLVFSASLGLGTVSLVLLLSLFETGKGGE